MSQHRSKTESHFGCLFVFVVNDDSVDFAGVVVVVCNQDISEAEHTIHILLNVICEKLYEIIYIFTIKLSPLFE